MKIGVDLTVLQSDHRMRGIGYVLKNFLNHAPRHTQDSYVFYIYPHDEIDPLESLHIEGLDYEIRYIARPGSRRPILPGRFGRLERKAMKAYRGLRDAFLGDSRRFNFQGIDYFLQVDQNQPLPAQRKVKSMLFLHDLIPIVLEADYLWTYSTARNRGLSKKAALARHVFRNLFILNIKRNALRAVKLAANSNHTKQDFVSVLGISSAKISVAHLGSDPPEEQTVPIEPHEAYAETSWGYIKQPIKNRLREKPFLLYVGGVDQRRKLKDLLAAYNNLRARGYELNLVMTGDVMKGPKDIPNDEVRQYLVRDTSYVEDISFLGFVTDQEKAWLYKNALAFVYPTVYEGFGLPILEAMQYGAPVITYNNSSIPEVAGDAAIYANNFHDIKSGIIKLVADKAYKERCVDRGYKQVKSFSWEKTADKIISLAEKTSK